jgi:hypothetical protein
MGDDLLDGVIWIEHVHVRRRVRGRLLDVRGSARSGLRLGPTLVTGNHRLARAASRV